MLLPRFAPKDEAIKALGGRPPCVLPDPVRRSSPSKPGNAGIAVEIVGDRIVPDITYVARLGLLADPATAPPRPLYLKAPEAKPPARAALAPAPEPA